MSISRQDAALIRKRYGKPIRQLTLGDIETLENTQAPSGAMTPYTGKQFKAGTLRWWGDPFHDIDILKPLDIGPVTCQERIEEVKTHQTTKQYIKWAKEGKIPPPITITEGVSGKMYSMNRRRLYAMQQAGVTKTLVWHPLYGAYDLIVANQTPKKKNTGRKQKKR